MTQVAIEALLRQKTGLDASLIGSNAIARAVRQRMAECGLTDMQSYLTLLQTSSQELLELIENTIVPETWFFRDREPFTFLGRYAITEWLQTYPNSVLRVLSVPCSTGEEPYSIAIALMSAGLASKKIRIDAVDISKKALLKAKRARYDKNSFRGDNLTFRQHYFEQKESEYQLCELVSSQVNFIHGNLLEPYFLVDKAPYDVIFCRNLLIYFDSAARERTMQVLDRLLTKKGLLFVGHSETGQLLTSKFVSVRHPLAFAYRKVATNVGRDVTDNLPVKATVKASVTRAKDTRTPVTSGTKTAAPRTNRAIATDMLETARSLADCGRLDEAATLCETYLRQNRLSAEGYFLLGEVRQALGDEEQAIACFDKAIYLQPNHYEALMHLALLKEHRGDIAGAAIVRQRLQRLQK